MRKLLLLILTLFIANLAAMAGRVSEAEALQKAQQFMQSKQFMQKNLRRAPSAGAVDNSYYVFNVEDCQGFVIVAADDCMPDILGYSDKGHFDLSKAPDNVKWLMDYYAKIAKSLKDNPTTTTSRRAPIDRPEVQPLIKTTWDQGNPYNMHCPVIQEGYLTLTGCVATAMAQVVNFFQWPLEDVKAIAGYTTGDNVEATALPAKKFNWYNMSEDDIAWLMRYCGQAVMMNYGIAESGAAPAFIPFALTSYFGFSKSIKIEEHSAYGDGDWEELIYNEVNLGRPVIYSGFQGSDYGHTFIVHGYRDGMFMVNWGWSGDCDGYFMLTNLAPSEYMSFPDQQNAVINIQPVSAEDAAIEDEKEVGEKTIDVKEAGTLSTLIPEDEKYSIKKLTLTGAINGTDIELIRDMAGNNYDGQATDGELEDLDLSNTTIVEGGEPYLQNHTTVANQIGDEMFAYCPKLKNIKFPQTTTSIGERILDSWPRNGITSVFIPKSVTQIAIKAFSGPSISSIEVEEGNPVYRSQGNAIYEVQSGKLIIGCSSTVIPEGVTTIGSYAFAYLADLVTLKLPESLTTIEEYAFVNCSLKSLTIPKNVNNIVDRAFSGVQPWSIVVDGDNPTYDSRDNCNAIIETATNTLIVGCAATEIPEGITALAPAAFFDQRYLTSIKLPNTLKSIGAEALRASLRSIDIPQGVTSIDGYAFHGEITIKVHYQEPIEVAENAFSVLSPQAKLIVPDGTKEKYETTVGWNAFASSCIIEESSYNPRKTLNVATAGTLSTLIAEEEKYTIEELALTGELNGSDLRFLQDMAGYDGNQFTEGRLSYLDISNAKIVEGGSPYSQADELGNNVFFLTSKLESVILPKSLKYIGNSAFSSSGIKSIVIPKSVVELGSDVFYYCPLVSISVEEGNPVFDSRDNCNAVIETATNTLRIGCRKTIIPNSVVAIGETAFSGRKGLISMNLPGGVTSIGSYAFWSAEELTTINISKNIVEFGNAPFGGCENITSFTIDPENPVYDSRDNCNAIIETATNTLIQGFATTKIPDGVKTIAPKAFRSQPRLTTIEIPSSVTDIQAEAFLYCNNLIKVISHIKRPYTLNAMVFEGDNIPNATLYVPYGTRKAYASTPGWNNINRIVEMEPDDSYQGNSASIAVADLGKHYAAKNGEVEVPISITGEGIVPVTSIDYTINNSTEQHLEIEPISYMMTAEVLIPLAADATTGEQTKTLKITKVNGVVNECTENVSATGTLVTVAKKPKIIPVVEEYTGTWCGWCARGIVGLKMLDKTLKKDVITIAIHDGGDNEPMMLPEYRSTSGSYPSCQINRGELMDPYYGTGQKAFGIKREVEAAQRDYALGSIKMTANWTDDTRSAIDIRTTTTFVEDVAESPYQIGYILLENGVKGTGDEWAQSNYYAGSNTNDENLKELTNKPSKITDMKYDNVPVQVWEPMTGVAGTIPATITHDVPMEYTFKVDISGNTRIQNKNRLTVVVLLLDKSNGKIVNAAKFSLAPAVTITAKSYTREYGEANPTFGYYTVEGVELDGTPDIMCEATATSPVGTYPIIISKGNISNDNDTYIDGTLTITKAPLTITAKSYTITQGDALPTFDVEYSGFKNNETADILTKKPTLTTSVTSSSEPGTFDIVASGAEAQNYEISYVKGTLTINPGVYKLTYMVDGEVYKTYDVVYDTAITPEAEPTKEGYTFSGWSEIPETMPAHDVTVTGTFSINSYKLTYTVDGEVYKTYDIEYGATITPEAEPTKEGYTFSGWSEIPATMPAHDVTITGSFSKGQYKLIYMVDGQTYKTINYDYGDAITPEPAPTKEGYTFSGWSEIPETMPAHDVTVTGSFSINKYKLTYIVDGVEYKSYDIEYGATITPEVEPTKEGYTFSGWSEIPATMPAHDVTVTGTFTLDTGIEQIMRNANGDIMIFTIDGKRVDNLKKGMNVIRMSDGTTRKVVVK